MSSKDVTKIFGNIGFVLPLLLIFFTAAGSAYACPEHRSKAAHRTKAINTRTVSYMTPVVITYGGRCADNINGTRRVKHVSMMGDGYFEGGARYVAVRNKAPRTRYVAVRDIDYDDVAPRYVAVRNYAPRTRQVVVRDIDYDDTPRYVAVRRQPVYVEPVAVRNIAPRARYIAASDIDYDDDDATSYVAARSIDTDLDVEIARPRHVVVRTDNLTGTEEVIHSSPGDDDISDIAPPIENVATTDAVFASNAFTGGVVHDDFDVGDQAVLSDSGVTYVAAGNMEETCLPDAVIDTSPELVTIRAVSDASIDDIVKDAHSRGTDVTHVYDDDGHSIRYRPFVNDGDIVATETADVMVDDVDTDMVSYVRISDVDDVDATDVSYVPAESASYALVDDSDVGALTYVSNDSVVKLDTTDLGADMVSYVPVSDIDDVEATDVSYLPAESASYVPVGDSELSTVTFESDDSVVKLDTVDLGADMVSYVPISDVDDVDATDVTYLPAEWASYALVDNSNVGALTYVSNDSIVKLDAMEIDTDADPTIVSTLDGEPVEFADSVAIPADDAGVYAVASLENEDIATTDSEDPLFETDIHSNALPDLYLEGDSDEIEYIAE